MSDRMKTELDRKRQDFDKANKWTRAMLGSRQANLTWDDVGAEDLKAALVHVTEDGAALLLAKTSDGGALMVQVLVGVGQNPKFYAASMAELNMLLEELSRV